MLNEDNGKAKTTKLTLAEIEAEYGPAPVLRSENPNLYVKMFAQFTANLQPQDFLLGWLIKKAVDEAWLMNRYPRHQTLGIERQYKKDVDFQIQRIKAQNARREDTASKIAARATEQPTDVAHAIHLEDTFLESVTDIDEIMERGPSEHDHNRALQRTMEFQESLERSHNNATARFHRTLELITDYSEGLSKRVREGREQIVDADYRLLEGPTEAIEPSGNPPPANSKCSNECQNLQETVAPPLSPQAEQREEAAAAPDESSAIRSDRATE